MDVLLTFHYRRRRRSFPIFPRAQQGEIERGDGDPPHLVAALPRPSGISIRERVAEMASGWIGMALDDQHALGHGVTRRPQAT
jgi:hypothetical protein